MFFRITGRPVDVSFPGPGIDGRCGYLRALKIFIQLVAHGLQIGNDIRQAETLRLVRAKGHLQHLLGNVDGPAALKRRVVLNILENIIQITVKLPCKFIGILISHILDARDADAKVIIQIHGADAREHDSQEYEVQGAGDKLLGLHG